MTPKQVETAILRLNKRIQCLTCELENKADLVDGEVPESQLPPLGGTDIQYVENYAALPDPTTVSGETWGVLNSQGTKWLPWTLGGTYYPKGFYYSNGMAWVYMGEFPHQATQAEVDAGVLTDVFVSPATFENAAKWGSIGGTQGLQDVISEDNVLTIDNIIDNSDKNLSIIQDNGFLSLSTNSGISSFDAWYSIGSETGNVYVESGVAAISASSGSSYTNISTTPTKAVIVSPSFQLDIPSKGADKWLKSIDANGTAEWTTLPNQIQGLQDVITEDNVLTTDNQVLVGDYYFDIIAGSQDLSSEAGRLYIDKNSIDILVQNLDASILTNIYHNILSSGHSYSNSNTSTYADVYIDSFRGVIAAGNSTTYSEIKVNNSGVIEIDSNANISLFHNGNSNTALKLYPNWFDVIHNSALNNDFESSIYIYNDSATNSSVGFSTNNTNLNKFAFVEAQNSVFDVFLLLKSDGEFSINIPSKGTIGHVLKSVDINGTAEWAAETVYFTLPSLTAGSVLFSNGTTIAEDNSSFFWDDTNNRLGIGTSTPDYPLDIVAPNVGTGEALRLEGTGSGTSILMNNGAYAAYYTQRTNGKAVFTSSVSFGVDRYGGSTSLFYIDTSSAGTSNIGILTEDPTHSLTFSSVTTGIAFHNQIDQISNYERGLIGWDSNIFRIALDNAGSGTTRSMRFSTNGTIALSSPSITLSSGYSSPTANRIFAYANGTTTASSGTSSMFASLPTINQTSTGGYRALWVSPYEQGTGSGSKLLIDLGTNTAASGAGTHTSRFSVSSVGDVKMNSIANTTTSSVLYYDTTSKSVTYGAAPTGNRFGVSGEDVIATANRGFNADGYDFVLSNAGILNLTSVGSATFEGDFVSIEAATSLSINIPTVGIAGYVLTAIDAVGTCEWQPAPSGGGYSVATVTSATHNETVTAGEKIILCDTTSNSITVNLPTAVGNVSKITIKKIVAANTVTVDGFSTETIDGSTTASWTKENYSITLISDNSNWHII